MRSSKRERMGEMQCLCSPMILSIFERRQVLKRYPYVAQISSSAFSVSKPYWCLRSICSQSIFSYLHSTLSSVYLTKIISIGLILEISWICHRIRHYVSLLFWITHWNRVFCLLNWNYNNFGFLSIPAIYILYISFLVFPLDFIEGKKDATRRT